MADNAEGSGDPQITFKVKAGGDSHKTHTVTIGETATVQDLKTMLAGEEYENIPIERQRLIYSGRVMKNDEALATYKIKPGNTIHLVKSAASNPAPQPAASTTSTPQAVPSNMAAGTSANNILAGLTGARFAGHAPLPNQDIFGPDGGMNLPSEDQMADMLSNPQLAATMNEALNNPNFVDFMIQSNPMLRNMPNARELINSPYFRSMMTNPDSLRMASRMRGMMGPGGGNPAFPAPGATDTTPAGAPASASPAAGAPGGDAANPFAMPPSLFGGMPGAGPEGAGPGANPFFAMLQQLGTPPAGAGTSPTSPPGSAAPGAGNAAQGGAAGAQGRAPPNHAAANPFAGMFGAAPGPGQVTPEMMQQALQMLGAGGMGGMGGMSGMSAAPAAPAAPDNRPPEEVYADQLRQLNEMGFYDFDRNVTALRRSGGSVQGAIQHLLGD